MKRQSIPLLTVAAISVLSQLTFAALPRYEITDLGTLGGFESRATGINDKGQVVGASATYRWSNEHAFLWDPINGMTDLGTLPDKDLSYAASVNDYSEVVGYSGDDDGSAFIWDSTNGMRYMDGIGDRNSEAWAINNTGQVAGSTWGTWANPGRAFIWDSDNGVIYLGTLGGTYSSAWAINNTGKVVGGSDTAVGDNHAFLWDTDNGMRDLGTLGGRYSCAHGVNDAGHVVGWSHTKNVDWHAFLWDSINGMTDLGPGIARAINNAGQVVGDLSSMGPAFYWDSTVGMIPLSDLLPPDWRWQELRFASGMNNRGQIVGEGITDSGEYHAFLMAPVPPKVIYVDDDATGANDGSSWADAFNYLQDALTAAWSGDEIRVAQGTYKPDQGAGITPGDREDTFQLISGVTLKGGYAGASSGDTASTDFGQPDPNARDIELYETILSGDLNGNDVDVNDPADLLDEPTRAENSYHVVTGTGTDETAILDGFTITAGNDYIYSGGAGMYNEHGSPTLLNCTFKWNSTLDDGGGMYNREGSSPTLTNCTFSGNYAFWGGGGMYNDESSPKLTNCTFSGNEAYSAGGMSNSWSNPTLTNCTFSGNYVERSCGGMYNGYSSPTLINCTFSGNLAPYDAGGMYNYESSPRLTNCVFSSNTGPVMYNSRSNDLTLTNCTFAQNSANNGNALACDSYLQQYPSNLVLTNCILWDGGDEIRNNDNSTITITYSDVEGNWSGEGNIDADPCFAEPGYWDANGLWVEGDYHLLQSSPCINAGDPNYIPEPNETDLDGKPRIIGGRIDMGAYESPVPAEVRIVPRTINLTSKGKWITCYIWLGEDYDVADIDPNSVLLENEIQPDEFSADEEQQVAVAKFSREELRGILNVGDAELTITGQLTDGTVFEGTDIIRVLNKAGKK